MKYFFTLLFFPVVFFGQTTYIKKTVYKSPTQTPVSSPSITDAVITNYIFNGDGRLAQKREHMNSNSGNDIVTNYEYDAMGRESKIHLPYVNSTPSLNYDYNALSDQLGYYGSPNPSQTGNPYLESTNNPYNEIIYESSVLGRELKMSFPGDDWSISNDNIKITDYQTNTTTEQIKLFKAVGTWNSGSGLYTIALTANGSTYHPQGQLYKIIKKNENWVSGDNNTVHIFIDKQGRRIMSRVFGISVVNGSEINTQHDTYYVYDQYGNLTYVIPPLADTNIDQTVLDNLCYQYKYDSENRLCEKKLPAKRWEYYVYDKLNRLIASGPAKNPFSNLTTEGWDVRKYDAFNRVIINCWVQVGTSVNSSNRKALQDQLNLQSSNFSENKSTSNSTINGISFRYTNVAYPTSGYHVLSVNYYDDYNFSFAPSSYGTVEGESVYYNNSSLKPNGLITGIWTRALQSSTTYTGEASYFLYDKYSRVIRSHNINYLGGYTQIDNKYDFRKLLYRITKHKRSTSVSELYLKDNFTYTSQDRLLTHTHQIGLGGTPQLLYKNEYDELGTLITERIGGTDITGSTSLQKVDYRYNSRGWLTHINDISYSTAPPSMILQDSNPHDLFSYKINYNTVENTINGAVVPLYNGNIAEIFWKTGSDNILRKYGFNYDAQSRLKNAIYQKPPQISNNYNESITYDKNGNIHSLQRTGAYDGLLYTIPIDNLSYTYASGAKNKLLKVIDGSNIATGFQDGTNTDDDYSYDSDGNMTADKNKGITQITYNHLNLPKKVTFASGNIEYIYDATGGLLARKVTQSSTVNTYEYLRGFQYANTVLNHFPTKKGYVEVSGSAGAYIYNYVYQYKDHLGNIRLSYGVDPQTSEVRILSENNYYPFGLKHENYNSSQYIYTTSGLVQNPGTCTTCPSGYIYGFQEQEHHDELGLKWLNFKWRNYDSSIGRFVNIDPLAEKFTSSSPYSYAFNNPVYYAEIDGLEPTPYEAALMADHVYNNSGPLVGGWAVSSFKRHNKNERNGLQSTMYERTIDGKKEYAYVYAGTDPMSWQDIKNDLTQAIGKSEQYEKVEGMAREISKDIGGKELTFVGHSLGGGLSNLSSLVTGRTSITFNPAWLAYMTLRKVNERPLRQDAHRTNYVHESDPLDAFQKTIGGKAVLDEIGETIILESDLFDGLLDALDGMWNGHFMGEMIDMLEDNGLDYYHGRERHNEAEDGFFDYFRPWEWND